MSARTLRTFADMELGATSSHTTTIEPKHVSAYAALTGDHNPIHEDTEYTATTRFGRPVAHGLLVAGFVQTALTKLVAPGGVSTGYQINLVAPAFAGATITAHATCAQLNSVTRRATFTIAVVDDETGATLVSGTAVVAFPKGDHR